MTRVLLLMLLLAAPLWAQPAALTDALKSPQTTTVLRLAGMNLETVPDGVMTLTNLQQLVLNENRLTSIPEGLVQLTKLQTLWVAGNKILVWPESLASCPLVDLDAARNSLPEFPRAFYELSGLKTLNLRQNGIATLPADIGRLSALQTLNLSGNQLTGVPSELSQCKSLKTLDLSGNRIPKAEQDRIRKLLPGVEVTF